MSLGCLLAAPLLDARVVAGKEYLGNGHPAVLGGPRVLRPARRLDGKVVLGQRVGIADHSGNQARDRIDQHHRGDLATAQDIVADRYLARVQGSPDPVVDALVPSAHDDQPRLCRQAFGQPLVERLAPRLHEHNGAGVLRPNRLDRLDRGLRLEDHSRPAAERHVIDLPVPVMRVLAQVVRVQLEEPALDGAADHTLLENRAEHGREDRDDVEPHLFYLASSTENSQSATTMRPALTSTSTTASLVAGMRCSTTPSRLTHTSLAGRSRTSAIVPRGRPELVSTARPTTWW